MPIFEYKCAKCGHVMEVLQKSRTGEPPTCEKCGGADLKKLLSGFAVGKAASAACDSCFERSRLRRRLPRRHLPDVLICPSIPGLR